MNIKILALTITLLLCFSCSQNKSEQEEVKKRTLIERENELLKKDNELLKKEQELYQKKDQQTNNQQQSDNITKENLDFLIKLNGKYPHEVKLLDNPILKKRLKKMLGSQYNFMKSIWQVEIPIAINDGFFYVWAMQAHSGGDPGVILMADIEDNVLYVVIKKR